MAADPAVTLIAHQGLRRLRSHSQQRNTSALIQWSGGVLCRPRSWLVMTTAHEPWRERPRRGLAFASSRELEGRSRHGLSVSARGQPADRCRREESATRRTACKVWPRTCVQLSGDPYTTAHHRDAASVAVVSLPGWRCASHARAIAARAIPHHAPQRHIRIERVTRTITPLMVGSLSFPSRRLRPTPEAWLRP